MNLSKILFMKRSTRLAVSIMVVALAGTVAQSQVATHVVISEVYGGGGNTGAPYTNDFVELYNPTSSTVDISNWSIQYASATGTSWTVNSVGSSKTISSHGFFLIQLAAGTTPSGALPTPDATGTSNMSATAGKVCLVNNTTPLSGANPTDASIVDKIGYGSTATGYETAVAPAPSNTTSIERKAKSGSTAASMASGADTTLGNGYDSDNNSADFVAQSTIKPQNTASPTENPPSGIADGDGSASISNSSVSAGILAGLDIFDANSATQTVVLKIVGTSTGTLTSARVTIPTGWTGFSGGNVALSGTGFSGASTSISGDTITVNSAALSNIDTGVVTITGLTTPNPTNLTDNGNHTFNVQTAKSAGVLTNITGSPVAYVIIPIANLRDVKSNGAPQDSGAIVAVKGVATVANNAFSTTTLQVFVQDSTGGINIFRTGTPPTFTEAHQYIVKGNVALFNGLTELIVSNVSDLHDNGVVTAANPQELTVPQLMANPESYEGRLVIVRNLNKSSGTWGANLTLTMTDGTNTVTLFVDGDTDVDNNTEPAWPKDITGIFSQSDNTSPYIGDFTTYQIIPRRFTDITNVLAPGFVKSKSSVAFGNVHYAEVKTDSIQVKNTGTATLNITSVASTDTQFVVGPSLATIAPSDSAMFYVVFVGLDTGSVSAKVIFTHNGASVKDTVSVSATGKMGISLLDKSSITIGPIAVSTSKNDSVTMMNVGNDSLRVTSVVSSLPTVFSVSPMVITLGVGTNQKFIITATLDSAKQRKATIYFVHDGRKLIDSVQVTLNSTTAVSSKEQLPKTFELSHNYPNPFNPSTTIDFALPQKEFVSLRVYNLLGQEVASLLNADMTAGKHSVRWDGKNNSGQFVPSGVYVYRLRAGEFDQTRRMVLLK